MNKISPLINTLKTTASHGQLHAQISACVLKNNRLATIPYCNTLKINKACCNQGSTHAERNAVMGYFGNAGEYAAGHRYRLKGGTDKIE
jgi:hypothetical protein